MEQKKSLTTIRFFKYFLIFYSPFLMACGWSESSETTRLALFRAERSNFLKLRPFCYSAEGYASVTTSLYRDQRLNCLEWQRKLSSKINVDDIFQILYKTDPQIFQNAIDTKSVLKVFGGNTFVRELFLKKNSRFLKYIIVAKKLEYNNNIDGKWERWDKIESEWNDNSSEKRVAVTGLAAKLSIEKDSFLKQRYAFLLLRYNFYENEKQAVIQLYNDYFINGKSVLNPWAMYYMALCVEDKSVSNYYLSKVFVDSDEKAYAAILNYNHSEFEKTYALAKNDFERGIIKTIKCLRNPAPALQELKEISKLIPKSGYFSFLIQREINKIEDWIFAPKYAQNESSIQLVIHDDNFDYERAKKENFAKDLLYLESLKLFLVQQHKQSSGEQKDFLSAAIAQLCFIDDDIVVGKMYTSMISANANNSIQLQKNIQLSLIALKQDDLSKDSVKAALFVCFQNIENLVEGEHSFLKSLYTLSLIASKSYQTKNLRAIAGLLFLKSQNKKSSFNDWNYYPNGEYYYFYIGYFDRFARTQDVDQLISLIFKKDQTPFEKYLCAGTTVKNINVYKDLKGTIAFRKNDLEFSEHIFAEIPANFWQNRYDFKSYLNEDPFFPKVLSYSLKKRNYSYNFNKTEFVRELIKLRNDNSVKSFMKLAHAYFNISKWGNSWMMTAYGISTGDYDYNDFIFGGNRIGRESQYQNGNFYHLNLAKKYYRKVLKSDVNNEDKALASLMLFECEYYSFYSDSSQFSDNPLTFLPGQSIRNFGSVYKNTNTFKKYNCALLESYLN